MKTEPKRIRTAEYRVSAAAGCITENVLPSEQAFNGMRHFAIGAIVVLTVERTGYACNPFHEGCRPFFCLYFP